MNIENITRISLSTRSPTKEQRKLSICLCMESQIIIDNKDIFSLTFHKIFCHRSCSIRCNIQKPRRTFTTCNNNNSIFHTIILLQNINNFCDTISPTSNSTINTNHTCIFLCQYSINCQCCFTRLSVPKDKFELFKETQAKEATALCMSVWVGDFSQERDEDVELPDAAYHVNFYLTDPYGGQDGCTIYTFAEDCGEDLSSAIKEFDTADGGYAVAVCFNPSDDIWETLWNSDKCRVTYYILSKGKYVDGSWDEYTEKALKTDISTLKFGKISNKAYTGKALTPTVVVKDGKKKLVNGTNYTVTYKNNKKIGTATVTITGMGEYAGTKTLKFRIVPPKTTLTSKPGKTSGGWKRATLSWKGSAGADG